MSPRIVVASDRLATNKDGLTFQIGTQKLNLILPNCGVMMAGDSSRGEIIINKVTDRLVEMTGGELGKAESVKIQKIVEIFKEEYKKLRKEAIETDVFEARGLNSKDFYENMGKYPDWFSLIISNQAENYDFDTEFLIFGFDLFKDLNTATVHLYQISDKGEARILDMVGFGNIGIGATLSLPEITKEPHSPNSSLGEALVRTYLAKKSSERVSGVGRYTDIGILFTYTDKKTNKISSNYLFLNDQEKKILDDGIEDQKHKFQETTKNLEVQVLDKLLNSKQNEEPTSSPSE